ncbi:MAG: pyridoxal 4-dehydrogenase [Sphingomonas bacterium]|uniref:aldo/keto reductase n=1 Tax=Sphingomonas bacterium TaxID=1895847 RepID=UPI00262057EC|nr:aldo/keto reductase [Sphingomonas bacterium]MDB5704022.1 pyridoxal 4-dehydrogenase [Sphingomonas bacterium]
MSGIPLPRIGMGTAAIGNLYRAVSDDEARETIVAALDAGIGYFDTAPYYGFGLAERRLGDALAAESGRRAIVSTKIGRLLEPTSARGTRHGFVDADPFEPLFDYGADGVRRAHEASLKRLRRDRVEILFAHDLGAMTHGDQHERHRRAFLDGGYAAMRALRDTGAVDAIGIGVNEVAIGLDLLPRVELDLILLAGRYTLLDRNAADALFALCAERGVRVIIGGPYNSGILAQEDLSDAGALHYDYEAPSPAMLSRARRLEDVCASHGVPLPAAALQFPLRHPRVATVIPGMVGASQVRDTLSRAATPVPDLLWKALDQAVTPSPDALS